MNTSSLLRRFGLPVIALAVALPARADIIVERDTLVTNTRFLLGVSYYSEAWLVNDGVTLTFHTGTARAAGGVFNLAAGASLTLGPNPAAPLGTGRVVFRDIYNVSNGGALYSFGTLRITGASFINTRSGIDMVGGAIFHTASSTAPGALLTLDGVEFIGCSAGNSGALRNNNSAIMAGSDLRFDGNAALNADTASTGGNGGAFGQANSPDTRAVLGRAVFVNNRARASGGAVWLSNGSLTLENPSFTGNWAGLQGGAIYNGSRPLDINITAGGAAADFLYSGNRAGGGDAATYDEAVNNAPLFAPSAAAGGFLYTGGVNTFNIGAGATLTIGLADAADRAADSIASRSAAAQLVKTGAGGLVLNADNSHFTGATAVSAGSLLLGNAGASLGGAVTVASGATFGGAGAVRSGTGAAGLSLAAGATLQVGLAGRAEEALSITGALTLNNATLAFVAAGGTHAAQLALASAATATGTTRVDLRFFQTGAYNLGALAGRLGANLRLLANGADISASSRQRLADISAGGDLILDYSADRAREMRWDAAGSGVWDSSAANARWADIGEPASGVTEFAGGDAVVFDNAGAGAPAAITLADRALVTAMTVDESGTLAFTGAGGITGAAYFQNNDADAPAARAGAGRLVKNGAGTLRFENTGGNTFDGGIEINGGGVIEFTDGGQLRTGAGAIVFNATGTLRAAAAAVLENNLTAAGAGAAIVLDTGGGGITHTGGVIAGAGVLRKQGAGVLALDSANTIAGVELAGGVLRAGHAKALGAGALEVAGDGATLELADGITLANAVRLAGRELTVRAASGAGTLAGALTGGRLLVAAAPGVLGLSGANALGAVTVQTGGTAAVLSPGALGGATVRVRPGGALAIGVAGAVVGDTAVETGGALAFSYLNTRVTGPRLRVEGTLELAADSVIAMQKMPSAKIWLATATGDLIDSGAAITAEIGSGPVRLLVEGRDLYALNLDWAANPGKDVAAAFDALTALSAAVRARVGEGFLLPLVDRGAGGGKNSLWVKTVGSRARRDGDAEKTGHEDETLGLIVGCDKMLGANLLVGGHAGYTCSEITTGNRAETTVNQPFAGLYASYKAGRFYATADATAGTLDADTLRHEGGNRVTGSYQAVALGAGAEIGAVLPLGNAATLRPAAALHGMRYRFGHHMEFAPAGEGALMLDDFTVNHVESLAGVRFARAFRTPWALPGMVEVSAGWRRTLHDDDAPLGVTFASNETERAVIERAVYRRDRANLGAALRFALRADMLASLAYDYEFASGSTRDTLAASFAWSW